MYSSCLRDGRQRLRMWEQCNSPINPLNGNVLRIREFCSSPNSTNNTKSFFCSGKGICDVLENGEEIDLPPRWHSKSRWHTGTNTRAGYCCHPPTPHLAGAWDTASLLRQGPRTPVSSCRWEQASMARFIFLFIIPLPRSLALGINWFVGAREIAASFGCHILNPCQICVARTGASVFNPECIWPLVFSMTQNKH